LFDRQPQPEHRPIELSAKLIFILSYALLAKYIGFTLVRAHVSGTPRLDGGKTFSGTAAVSAKYSKEIDPVMQRPDMRSKQQRRTMPHVNLV
jgi:hypothetical protein